MWISHEWLSIIWLFFTFIEQWPVITSKVICMYLTPGVYKAQTIKLNSFYCNKEKWSTTGHLTTGGYLTNCCCSQWITVRGILFILLYKVSLFGLITDKTNDWWICLVCWSFVSSLFAFFHFDCREPRCSLLNTTLKP